ncbi:hypothetical protein [Pseudomonas rubra]|uniref:Uncharacterized protein n=1 Tax=Pseudomonas rubra TaxID=2942627 RepID=A0ABT5PB44_9PSED|nr:hypothetical protein [Pseudomonas rubra]MDD1015412.1 hypothetical protein [Pseudomonas rubra]MDD1039634.1 hypothetical protein [Pseudomonas rubra]MDD1153940.1 hypothetical protein [Pseudomonas rubra]
MSRFTPSLLEQGASSTSPQLGKYKAPVVPAAMALEPDDQNHHLIHKDDQSRDLQVVIDEIWPQHEGFPGDITHVDLLWDGLRVDFLDPPLVWPYDPQAIIPLELAVPQIYLATPGPHRVSYRINMGNPALSDEVLLNIDQTAPNAGEAGSRPEPIAPIGPEGLNEDYLAEHQGVNIRLESWSDLRLGDRVRLYWRSFSRQDDPLKPVDEFVVRDKDAPVDLRVPADYIRNSGDGLRYLCYDWEDRSGNRGPLSHVNEISVELGSTPSPLPLPQVEPAGLIDLDRARTGVELVINEIVDARPGDRVIGYWRGLPVGSVDLLAPLRWPVKFPVGFEVLTAAGFVERNDQVHFTWRGRPSRALSVELNLTVAGPDPQGPELVNPRLAAVVVKGRAGDDQLGAEDVDHDARVELVLYVNPQPGQVLQLYWGSHVGPAATYLIKPEDRGGATIAFSVPWAIINAVGSNPALPVYYSTFNGVNTQHAPTTRVDVQIRIIEGLARATFPGTAEGNWVNCAYQPWINGVKVRIPGDAQRLAENDQVTLFWVADRGQVGGGSH